MDARCVTWGEKGGSVAVACCQQAHEESFVAGMCVWEGGRREKRSSSRDLEDSMLIHRCLSRSYRGVVGMASFMIPAVPIKEATLDTRGR